MSADPRTPIALALESARALRPAVALDAAAFEASVRARAGDADPASLHLVDLHLAVACSRGEAAAIAAFEAELGPEIARALARLRVPAATADEIQQRLRHKLFVADAGAAPKIASYSGRGPLRAWVRALVAHEATNEHRRRRDDASESALGELAAGDDPELAQIRARYAGPFRDAFREALGALSPRDRNVLRLVYADGVSVEQVAAVYGVHRVSASRWLGQIRRELFERTRARLATELRLDASELASVTRLCLSQIDVSLDRLLADRD